MAYADITTKERNKGLKQVIDFFKQENSKKSKEVRKEVLKLYENTDSKSIYVAKVENADYWNVIIGDFWKDNRKKVCFIVFNPKVPEFTKVIIKSKRSTKEYTFYKE